MPTGNSGSAALAAGARLTIDTGRGAVTIQGEAERTEVAYACAALVTVHETPEGLHIEGGRQPLHLTVPRRVDIDLDCDGPCTVHAIAGSVSIDGGAGTVEVEDVTGDVAIEAGVGSLRVTDVVGDLAIDNGAGDVTLRRIAGTVAIDSGAGALQVEDVDGSLRVESGAGPVRLAGLGAGPVEVETGMGQAYLEFARQPVGTVRVEAGGGETHLRFPANAALDLDFEAALGAIAIPEDASLVVQHRTRHELHARLNGGGTDVTVENGLGRIRLTLADAAGAGLAAAGGALPAAEASSSADADSAPGAGSEVAGADSEEPSDDPAMVILRMVEAGTLTSAEATQLLAALEGEDPSGEGEADGDAPDARENDDGTGEADEARKGAEA